MMSVFGAEAVEVVSALAGRGRCVNAVLKQGKSEVLLVERSGTRAPVVAKLADAGTVANEGAILGLLASAPVASLGSYGVAPSSSPGKSWLVSEYAAGRPYSRASAEHRRVAGEWMARLHVWAESIEQRGLVARGSEHQRGVVEEARSTLEAAQVALAGRGHGLASVDALLAAAEELLERWAVVAAVLDAAPSVLAHGGFAGKNVIVARSEEPVVLAFDWEQGGWGSAAADLSMVDMSTYLEVRKDHCGAVAEELYWAVGRIGAMLWCLAPVPGERPNLTGPWPERALAKLPVYQSQLAEARAALDPLFEPVP